MRRSAARHEAVVARRLAELRETLNCSPAEIVAMAEHDTRAMLVGALCRQSRISIISPLTAECYPLSFTCVCHADVGAFLIRNELAQTRATSSEPADPRADTHPQAFIETYFSNYIVGTQFGPKRRTTSSQTIRPTCS